MLEWIAGLIPALPLVAALWIGIAIWFRRAHGEAHERRTSRIALTACTVSLAAALVLVAARLAGDLPDQLLLGRWLSSGDFQVNLNAVSYTHLDVYKRQPSRAARISDSLSLARFLPR